MTASERNTKIKKYFTNVIERAKKTDENTYKHLTEYAKIKSMLDVLIPHQYDGFRGVVMTAIGGMYLSKEYNPFEDFYSCSPRPVFENGIYYVLESFGIPSGKSAPLNVAKGIKKLDEAWVSGKKGNSQISARFAIEFLQILMSNQKTTSLFNLYVDYFFMRLEKYAESIRSIEVETIDFETDSKIILAQKLIQFTVDYPEGGTIPQMVVGKLIRFTIDKENKHVKGENESVFGTNTTSKKPADIWVEDNDGNTLSLYEITVKKIDFKRLDDSVHAISQLQDVSGEINYICRMPIDISTLELEENTNTLYYKGQWFNFIDIANFITNCIILLSNDELEEYFSEMKTFIKDKNRKEKTKYGWNQIFE